MLSFIEFLLETEQRIAGIKANPAHQNISMDHDPIGKHAFRAAHIGQQPGVRTPEGGLDLSKVTSFPSPLEQSHHVIDHLAKHDPTHLNGNKHTEWMVNQYKKGHIRLEDGKRMHELLTDFTRHKDKLANKDINSYTMNARAEPKKADLADTLAPHSGKAAGSLQREEGPGGKLIHKEGHVTVHRITSMKGAINYGKGTDWCTARPEKEENAYPDYKEGLYVVQHHDKQTGKLRKHQIHFDTNQFMDEKDNPVDPHHLVKEVPELKNVKQFRAAQTFSAMAFKEPHEHEAHMKNIIKNGSLGDVEKVARHVKGKPEFKNLINHMVSNSNKHIRMLGAMVGSNQHHQNLIHDHDSGVRNQTVRATDDQKIIEKGAYDHEAHVRASAALKVKDPIVHRVLMRDRTRDVGQSLAMNPHIDVKHVAEIANIHPDRWASRYAAERHHQRTGDLPKGFDPGRHNWDSLENGADRAEAKPGTFQHFRNLHDNHKALFRDSAFERTMKSHIHATAEKHYPGAFAAIERSKNPLTPGGIGAHDGKGRKHDIYDHVLNAVKQGWMKQFKPTET